MKKIYLIMTLVCMIMVSCSDNKHNVHEYVDLGLPSGVKWATCNIGANSPEEYGDYFAWGETSPKTEYTEENSITDDKQMSDISGDVQYDAARANLGGDWRMPTKTEMQELLDNCTWKWAKRKGINGCKVIGPNGNSIFLPAAGCSNGLRNVGFYWSSSPYYEGYDCNAFCLNLYNNGNGMSGTLRLNGKSVRPVIE